MPTLDEVMRLPTGTMIVDTADLDPEPAAWRVSDDGLAAVAGGAEDWDWRAIARNGGLSDSLTVVC